ncbi:hypothetical protein D3C76_1826640 [compost metagenome]
MQAEGSEPVAGGIFMAADFLFDIAMLMGQLAELPSTIHNIGTSCDLPDREIIN